MYLDQIVVTKREEVEQSADECSIQPKRSAALRSCRLAAALRAALSAGKRRRTHGPDRGSEEGIAV